MVRQRDPRSSRTLAGGELAIQSPARCRVRKTQGGKAIRFAAAVPLRMPIDDKRISPIGEQTPVTMLIDNNRPHRRLQLFKRPRAARHV